MAHLHRDITRRQMVLLVADPGTVHPAHVHETGEEIFVVSGDLTIDGAGCIPKRRLSGFRDGMSSGRLSLIARWPIAMMPPAIDDITR